MPENVVPQPCNREIFTKGESLLAADTSNCRCWGFEEWVQKVAAQSGQQVDWHYSGGVAHVLFVGSRDAVVRAAKEIPCPGRIMRWIETGYSLYHNFGD